MRSPIDLYTTVYYDLSCTGTWCTGTVYLPHYVCSGPYWPYKPIILCTGTSVPAYWSTHASVLYRYQLWYRVSSAAWVLFLTSMVNCTAVAVWLTLWHTLLCCGADPASAPPIPIMKIAWNPNIYHSLVLTPPDLMNQLRVFVWRLVYQIF